MGPRRDGYFQASRIGFSPGMNTAHVLESFVCGLASRDEWAQGRALGVVVVTCSHTHLDFASHGRWPAAAGYQPPAGASRRPPPPGRRRPAHGGRLLLVLFGAPLVLSAEFLAPCHMHSCKACPQAMGNPRLPDLDVCRPACAMRVNPSLLSTGPGPARTSKSFTFIYGHGPAQPT